MDKSTHSPHYGLLKAKLVELRREAGLTQRALADLLGREQNLVARIEIGDRRVDLVELHWICEALGVDSAVVATELLSRFKELTAED